MQCCFLHLGLLMLLIFSHLMKLIFSNRPTLWVLLIATYFCCYLSILNIKGAWSDCFRFLSNLQRFWYQKKAHIFFFTPGEFYSWKCTVWKILMKMWLVMVIIIKFTQYGIGNCNIRNLFLCPNGLTDLNEIWNQDILGDDASFE